MHSPEISVIIKYYKFCFEKFFFFLFTDVSADLVKNIIPANIYLFKSNNKNTRKRYCYY